MLLPSQLHAHRIRFQAEERLAGGGSASGAGRRCALEARDHERGERRPQDDQPERVAVGHGAESEPRDEGDGEHERGADGGGSALVGRAESSRAKARPISRP